MPEKVNLAEKFSLFNEPWQAKLVGSVNDMDIKLVKLDGEFIWHSHDVEDEMFFVTNGRMVMRFREKDVEVLPGEFIIVAHDKEHMPVADPDTEIMLIEPAGTVNTGNAVSDRTVTPQSL